MKITKEELKRSKENAIRCYAKQNGEIRTVTYSDSSEEILKLHALIDEMREALERLLKSEAYSDAREVLERYFK